MQQLTFSKACFREQIMGYFGDEQDRLKQPLALCIVEPSPVTVAVRLVPTPRPPFRG
jgi:hypothetical protein